MKKHRLFLHYKSRFQ